MDTVITIARVDRRGGRAPATERFDVDMPTLGAAFAFGATLADQRRRPGGETWRLDTVEADGVVHHPPANDAHAGDAPRALVMDAAAWEALMRLAQAGMDALGDQADRDAVAAHRLLRGHVLMVGRDEALASKGRAVL